MDLGVLISVSQLCDALEKSPGKIKVLDASWHMPVTKRNGLEEFTEIGHIPVAQFFDHMVCRDKKSEYKFMNPKASEFEEYVGSIGIGNDDHVVLYENEEAGFFSGPRAWWLFRVFGHQNVSILDGGFTRWVAEGKPSSKEVAPVTKKKFKATYNPNLVKSLDDILKNMKDPKCPVVDARPKGRFTGADMEPTGIPGGNIPGTSYMFFKTCASSEAGRKYQVMKDPKELQALFKENKVDLSKPFIAMCGTGMTACCLVLAAFVSGNKNVPVYDGSWFEYYMTQVKQDSTNL